MDFDLKGRVDCSPLHLRCVLGSDRRPSWWLGSCVAVEVVVEKEEDDEQTMPVCAILSDQRLKQLFDGQAGRDSEQAQQLRAVL